MSQTTFSGPVASQNGFIENSFTTAARDAIANPTVGLLIYNTTTNTYQVYNGTSWQEAFGPVIVTPTVVSISPNAVPPAGGNTAIITGTNFTSPAIVNFSGYPGTNVSVINTTAISVTIPAHPAGSVDVSVSTVDGTGTLPNGLLYYGVPTISNASPNVMAYTGGNVITFTGSNIGAPLNVGFTEGPITTYVTPTIINTSAFSATAPAQIGYSALVSVGISNPGGSNVFSYLRYIGQPGIYGVSPNNGSAAGGTVTTISGYNFYDPLTVTFGSNASTNVSIQNTNSLQAVTPPGAIGNVAVTVTTIGGSNTKPSAFSYVYVPPSYTNTQGVSFSNIPIAVSPTGNKLAAMGNANVFTYSMSTNWDLNTLSLSSATGLPNVSGKSYLNSPIAFNGNGTEMYTVVYDITFSDRYIIKFQLATPYDISSYLAPGTAVMPSPISGIGVSYVSSLFFSPDGLTGYIGYTSGGLLTINQYSFTSAYNVAQFSGMPLNSVNISGRGGNPWGMNQPTIGNMSSDGTYMLFTSAGNTYNGQMFRIDMSTPYNINTLSTTTANTYNFSAISGGYGPYNGLTIGGSNVYVLATCPNGGLAKFVLA